MHTSTRIINAECLNIGTESFLEIRYGLSLRLSFAVGWNIWKSGCN